jgi:proline dehydrogenase
LSSRRRKPVIGCARPGAPARARHTGPRLVRSLAMGLNSLLLTLTPKFVAKFFARPYIAGERRDQALQVADILAERHNIHSTMDLLGEAITDQAGVDEAIAEYEKLIADLGKRPHCWCSIKLSALGQEIDEKLVMDNTEKLLTQARDAGLFVRFDMEDHTTIDSTLNIYRTMREKGFDDIGIVLQSRLKRTKQDIEDLKDLKPNVRICIGIYNEPPEVATTDKTEMKEWMIRDFCTMIDNGQYVGLATHDTKYLAQAMEYVKSNDVPKDQFEIQMLLGVPRAKLQKQYVADGIKVRLYVPYGERWYPYSRRRLLESPDILGHVIRNILSGSARLDRT